MRGNSIGAADAKINPWSGLIAPASRRNCMGAYGRVGRCEGSRCGPRSNLRFIANRDAIATEQDTVIVHERPVSDGDVISIIAPNEVRD